MKKQAYRHGEILFIEIDNLPENLTVSKTNIITKGNTGNNHIFVGGNFYPRQDDDLLGYFEANNTILKHPDHGDKKGEAKLPNGFYEIRKGREFINEEMKPIID